MLVTSLLLKNFRCFKSLSFELEPDVTLFVAPNAGGKTAVLDGLAGALGALSESPKIPLSAPIRHADVRRAIEDVGGTPIGDTKYPLNIEVNVRFDDGTSSAIYRLLEDGKLWSGRPNVGNEARQWFRHRVDDVNVDSDNIWPVLAYYRIGRSYRPAEHVSEADEHKAPLLDLDERGRDLERIGIDRSSIPERRHGWAGSMNAAVSWKTTRDWWALEYLNAAVENRPVSPLCLAVENAVGCALGDVNHRPQWSSSERDILIWVPNQKYRPVESLSEGYRSAVALFADLARRCVFLNPKLEVASIKKTPGVVLIDEVELHLHPGWQRRVIPSLRKAFPLVQFVITTHSPQVVGSVPDRCIRIIEKFQVKKSPVATYGRDTNRILEFLMDTPPREEAVQKQFDALEEARAKEHWQVAWRLVDELRRKLGEDDPDITYYAGVLPSRDGGVIARGRSARATNNKEKRAQRGTTSKKAVSDKRRDL